MESNNQDFIDYFTHISSSNVDIYSAIEVGDQLWIPSEELERLLNEKMNGFNLEGLPLRTRSKVIKEKVCEAIGYPIPKSFKKTNPRFPGQNFDTYGQKSKNLQIWNEEISPNRRYILFKIDQNDFISKVKVVNGATLSNLDTTGTLTSKYQAIFKSYERNKFLLSSDTINLKQLVVTNANFENNTPVHSPEANKLLSIETIFDLLAPLVNTSFTDAGFDQERNRGAMLHNLICKALGYSNYLDNGQFPDIRHQLLEVKLQTSPTIDLGAIKPNDFSPLDIPKINNIQFKPFDIRYAIFYANISNNTVNLTHFYLVSGNDFFNFFPQMQGKKINKKLQIPLPDNFFDN